MACLNHGTGFSDAHPEFSRLGLCSCRALPAPPALQLVQPLPVVLQLVQAEIIVLSRCFNRVFLTRTICVVNAAAGAGSTLNASSPFSTHARMTDGAAHAPSMQLMQVQGAVMQSATAHDLAANTPHDSRPVQEEPTQRTTPRQRCRCVDSMLS